MIIGPAEYRERRQRLWERLDENSLAIINGGVLQEQESSAEEGCRRIRNFYYLTGCTEPAAFLVLTKGDASEVGIVPTNYLFLPPRNPEKEQWEGKKLDEAAAVLSLGVDEAYTLLELDAFMSLFLKGKEKVFFPHNDKGLLKKIKRWGQQDRQDPQQKDKMKKPIVLVDLDPLLAEQRLYKSFAEIAIIREACSIAAEAHQALMQFCRPHQMEYELEAEFRRLCCRQGCRRQAYPPIVAGGARACTLHYAKNDAVLMDKELVLVDAGGEYHSYASDITRSFPVNGRFTPDQKAIYEIVLQAQIAAIEKIFPGQRLAALQEAVVYELTKGLIGLGLLQGTLEELIDQKAYRPFYMHQCGHWLGLEVHDVGETGKECLLAPGMVLTVEPGLYIGLGEETVNARWLGIGIRIEDVLLVTETGYELLTGNVPKTVEQIEKLCQTGKNEKAGKRG